jgi:hypothetical protein
VEEVMEEDVNIPRNPSHFYILQDDCDVPNIAEEHIERRGSQGNELSS